MAAAPAYQSIVVRRKWLAIAIASSAVLTFTQPARASESPQAIIEHMRAAYAALPAYSDSGTVLEEYGNDSRDEHHFVTLFTRTPRRYLFDIHKANEDRVVVWGDPNAFHQWWKRTDETKDYPNPDSRMAIAISEQPTIGAITKIIVLLYPKASLNNALSHFEPESIAGTDQVNGHASFRLLGKATDVYSQTGQEANGRKLTVWIDTQSYLVRRILEESPAQPGMRDRTTTTFEPVPSPTIAEEKFRFTPPK